MLLILKNYITTAEQETLKVQLNRMGYDILVPTAETSNAQSVKQVSFKAFTLVKKDVNAAAIIDIQELHSVERIMSDGPAYWLASREHKEKNTIIKVKDKLIGANELTVMAGPCSVESEEQIHTIAKAVNDHGGQVLRGGAFKPRTSPYDFQGLGIKGLQFLHEAASAYNLLTVSEVMGIEHIERSIDYIDILQIGSRNMQNFSLLKAVGESQKPILLKRGMAANYQEWLCAAEYILMQGNEQVILCERGIRTFDGNCRNTLDLAAVPMMKNLSHLPIIVDPSHGTGRRELVVPMTKAAIAAGADGIMVEIHPTPDLAISDKQQAIDLATFAAMMAVILPHR